MNHIKLNNNNIKFINNIKQQFLDAKNKWDKQTNKILTHKISNLEFNNIPNIDQYHSTIIDSLNNFPKKYCLFTFSTHSRKINIHFIVPENKPDEALLKYLKHIFMWFVGIDSYTNNLCSKVLNVYICFSPSLKLLPNNKSIPIGKINANTAFTYTCNTKNVIHIFREEEWFKVLMHESFHNLDLDFSKYDHGFSDKFITSFFYDVKNVKFYEAYCEIWSLIFHSVFYSNQKNISLNTVLNKELSFSLFQCCKILDHYNMKYEYFYTNTNKAILSRKNYKEHTAVISYYIFKTIFLFNINNFLEWCYLENDKSFRFSKLPIQYIDIYQKIENFTSFLKSNYKNDKLIKEFKHNQIEFQRNKKSIQLNDIYKFKNLRMTYYDIMLDK